MIKNMVAKFMKSELLIGLLIIAVIISISGCGTGGGGGGGGGYVEPPEKKEARKMIDDVEKKIDDCEAVIEKAEKVGVKSNLIMPAREKIITARDLIAKARSRYNSGDYDSAKSHAKSAESHVLSARKYAETQIEKLREEVEKVLKEIQANITACESYIKTQSELGIDLTTSMKMISFAKEEIEDAWGRYDEEMYSVALEKSKKAEEDALEAKVMVKLSAKKLTDKTIETATMDVNTATEYIQKIIRASDVVGITQAKNKISDAANHLKMAAGKYEEEKYTEANDYSLKASELGRDAKKKAEQKLEFFVESNLPDLLSNIREIEDKIDRAHLLAIGTYSEDNKLDDVKDLWKDAQVCKLSGDFLSGAEYITKANNHLGEIEQSLESKRTERELEIIVPIIVLIAILAILLRMKK